MLLGHRLASITAASALALLAAAVPAAQARPACPDEELRATVATAPRVAAAVECLVAGQRARFGLPALTRDARLDEAARLHAVDMGVRDFFDHVTPEGLTPSDRARAQGYPTGAGENIAYGYPTARDVMAGWMKSAGHCRNVLSSAGDLGVGIGVTGGGVVYAAQGFGRYGSAPTDAEASCPTVLDAPTAAAPGPAAVVAPAPPAAAPSWRLLTRRVGRSGRGRIRLVAPTGAPPRVAVGGRERTLRRVRVAGPGRSLYTSARLRLGSTVTLADAAGTFVLRLRRAR